MYTGSFLVMKNQFGESAACMLSRGAMQGAQPSPRIYSVVFNPIQVFIRFLKRRWTAADDIDPYGASVFADDTAVKTDGPDGTRLSWTTFPNPGSQPSSMRGLSHPDRTGPL